MAELPKELVEVARDEIRKAGIERSLCALCDNPGRRMIRCVCEEYATAAIRATLDWTKENVSEKQWAGLARQIVMWRDMEAGGRPTGKTLHRHLELSGWKIPQWLTDEIPPTDHVPPKGTVAVVIYRAMIEALEAPTPPKDATE